MTEIAAWMAAPILLGMAVFQLLLVFGVPLGKMSWGGNHRILPPKLRLGSLISVGLFVLASIVLLEKADSISILTWSSLVNILVWFFVGLFGLSTFGNFMSKSKLEKNTMTPIAMVITLLFLVVAIGG